MGRLVSPLPATAPHRWDRASAPIVELFDGALEAAAELAVLEGANAAALRHSDGRWEIVQFAGAELLAPRTYRLTTLLRGQLGTEPTLDASVPAGATFVLLDRAVAQLALGFEDIGRELSWTWGPASRPIGHASYGTTTFAAAGIGLRPLSPVHARARTETSGDRILTWIRRTRVGGDSWEVAEVPLGEAQERYEVDILSAPGSATVVRTLTVDAPEAIYTAADQITDWGAPLPSYAVRIHQMSALVGRGAPLEAML
jgi:hypothetical protein